MKPIKSQLLLTLFILCSLSSSAYSVLTHEAIIDAKWDSSILPLLKFKYPDATDNELKDAHAYAYGGCVAPDMGYYPFGSKLFTNLVHYVRTGDFVNNILEEADNLIEYAFALGILCHYTADKYGHPLATNRCVPLVYPKDKAKYGKEVTYSQDPLSHIRMEFGFDILQTARGNYVSQKYHEFIGFKISRPVLERAFLRTYGLDINNIFKDFSLSIETFRWIIKDLFPVITKAAWVAKRKDIVKSHPGITRRKFEYKMLKSKYYHEYGKKHEKPGFVAKMTSVLVTVLPKVWFLKDLKLKVPGPAAEKLFIQSFDTVLVHYTFYLKKDPSLYCFSNIDFDTGNDTREGEYNLADNCYRDLLLKLQEDHFINVSPDLRKNIIAFYSKSTGQIIAQRNPEDWEKITEELKQLKASIN